MAYSNNNDITSSFLETLSSPVYCISSLPTTSLPTISKTIYNIDRTPTSSSGYALSNNCAGSLFRHLIVDQFSPSRPLADYGLHDNSYHDL